MTTSPYFQWTPVQHASHYELHTANDQYFSVNVGPCDVTRHDLHPAQTTPTAAPHRGTTFWRVRPIDTPYNGAGLQGIFSDPQAVQWSGRGPVGHPSTSYQTVTGLKIAITVRPGQRQQLRRRPLRRRPHHAGVLLGRRSPGITYYQVYVAQDANFTTTECRRTARPRTRASRSAPDRRHDAPREPGRPAYYWYIRPCKALGCGPVAGLAEPAPARGQGLPQGVPACGRPGASRPLGVRDHLHLERLLRHQPRHELARRAEQPVGQEVPHPGRHRPVVRRPPGRPRDRRPGDLHRLRPPLPGGLALLAGPGARTRTTA